MQGLKMMTAMGNYLRFITAYLPCLAGYLKAKWQPSLDSTFYEFCIHHSLTNYGLLIT